LSKKIRKRKEKLKEKKIKLRKIRREPTSIYRDRFQFKLQVRGGD